MLVGQFVGCTRVPPGPGGSIKVRFFGGLLDSRAACGHFLNGYRHVEMRVHGAMKTWSRGGWLVRMCNVCCSMVVMMMMIQ